MTLHPQIEQLRALVDELERAPKFARALYLREITDRTLEMLAAALTRIDRLKRRVVTLEIERLCESL